MGRIYSRGGAAVAERDDSFESMHERDRGYVERTPERESREAEVAREDFRVEQVGVVGINQPALTAPPPRPGMHQRWIVDGSSDPGGGMSPDWMRRMREGWAPRDPETVPKQLQHIYQSYKLAGGQGVIKVGGLVLCEQPKHIGEQRKLAVRDRIERQRKTMLQSTADLQKRGRAPGGVKLDVVEDSEQAFTGRRAATMLE